MAKLDKISRRKMSKRKQRSWEIKGFPNNIAIFILLAWHKILIVYPETTSRII